MAIQICREVTADVVKRSASRAVYAKQNDINSRFLDVRIQEDGKDIVVKSEWDVMLNVSRSDNQRNIFRGTVNEDGTVKVPLTAWMLELEGTLVCDISIVSDDPTVAKLTTMQFSIYVEGAAVSDESFTESTEYSVVVNLLKSASDTAEKINTLYDEISYAFNNGDFNGKSVYDFAREAGYTGTEEEFAAQMALYGEVGQKVDSFIQVINAYAASLEFAGNEIAQLKQNDETLRGEIQSLISELRTLNSDFYKEATALEAELFLKDGDTWQHTSGANYYSGVITGSGKNIIFSVPMNKIIKARYVYINSLAMTIRGVNEYVNSSNDTIVTYVGDGGATISHYTVTGTVFTNQVRIMISSSVGYTNAVNNTPISLAVGKLSLSFSDDVILG